LTGSRLRVWCGGPHILTEALKRPPDGGERLLNDYSRNYDCFAQTLRCLNKRVGGSDVYAASRSLKGLSVAAATLRRGIVRDAA